MILPTKHIRPDRSLIGVGAELMTLLDTPKTVSALWTEFDLHRQTAEGAKPVPFDWFVMALDFLFMVDIVDYYRGLLHKNMKKSQ